MIWYLDSTPVQKNQECAVPLGVQGDNQTLRYTADVSDWLALWPSGIVALVLQPPDKSEPYMANTSIDRSTGIVTWTITEFDTAIVGYGLGELRIVDGDLVRKSYRFTTYIRPSILAAAAEPPAPIPDWINELLEAASDTQANVDAAQAAQTAAEAAQSAAEESSGTAATFAEAAAASATSAASSKESAASSAVSAHASETRAANFANYARGYSTEAHTSAIQAAGSATEAAGSATQAAGSVTASETAQASAEAAQAAAEAAQAAAETAQGKAEDAQAAAEAAVSSAISDIQTQQQTSVAAVQSAGQTQITNIESKGAQTIASIPADYTELSDEVSDLKSATVKKDGTGEVTVQNLQIMDVVYSKNLWNPDTVTDGIWINPANGNESTGNYETTDYISVEAGAKYYGTWQLGATEGNRGDMNLNFVTCYDSSKTVMGSSGMTGPSNPITIPAGCSFVRISNSNNTYYQKRQFEKGTTATSYQNYGIVSAKIKDAYIPADVVESVGVTSAITTVTDNDVGKALTPKTVANGKVTEWQYKDLGDDGAETTFNLFDFTAWTDGFLNSSGVPTGSTPATASSTYATSDFIPASKGDVFVGSVKGQTAIGIGASIGYFAEYNSSKTLVRYDSSTQNAAPVTNENTAYVRITIRIGTFGTNLKLEKNAYGLFTSYRDNTVYKGLTKPSHIFIPKFIYVAVGRTIEIYNDQIILETDGYHIQYICQYGTAMNRKFTITGTSTMASGRSDSSLQYGQYRLFINIYNNDNQLVWQGASLIWVKSALVSAKTVIPIGDSLTNWKKWLPECIHLSNNNLTFVGTRYSGADQDSEGNSYASGMIHHEGRSGWSAASYLADTSYTFDDRYDGVEGVSGSANPFWDGTAFSLEHYLTTQEKSTPTAMQIWLGTNDIASGVDNAVTNIVSMVEKIRTEYENLKILVCNTIYRSNQDGYGSIGSDGYAGGNNGANAYAFNENIKVMELANKLTMALNGMTNVYVVPLYCSHDTEYNFGWEEYHPNPRATQIVHVPDESVHPATQGYWQIADILFSAYSVLL